MAHFRSYADVQNWLNGHGLDGTVALLRTAVETGQISGTENVRWAKAFIDAQERGEDTSDAAVARDLDQRQTRAAETQAEVAQKALELSKIAIGISIFAALLAAVAIVID
jgi:hypothetical protein